MSMWSLVSGLALTVFSIAFESIGIATALPTVMSALHAEHLYPWAFTTMISGMLVSSLVAGRVADWSGPAGPFYFGWATFLAGLLLGWAAPNVWVLLAARGVQGIGAGALNLALSVLVAHGFDAQVRPKVVALISFCWVLPAFLGPPVAAWLAVIDWRLVFLVMVPLLALTCAMTLPGLHRVQRDYVPAGDGMRKLGIGSLSVLAVAPSLILLAGQGGLGWARLVSICAGLAAMAWALPRVLAPATWGIRAGISSIVTIRALQGGSFYAAQTIFLVVLQNLRGLSPAEVGLALTIGSLGWSAAAWIQATPLLSRTGYIRHGAVLNMAGIGWLTVFAWTPQISLWAGLAGWILAGLGMGFSMASSAVAVMGLSSQHEQGSNQSSMQVADALGNAVCTAVSGGIYTALLSVDPTKLSFTAALCSALLVSLVALTMTSRIGPVAD